MYIYIYICMYIYVTYGHLFKCGISPIMHYIWKLPKTSGYPLEIIHFCLGFAICDAWMHIPSQPNLTVMACVNYTRYHKLEAYNWVCSTALNDHKMNCVSITVPNLIDLQKSSELGTALGLTHMLVSDLLGCICDQTFFTSNQFPTPETSQQRRTSGIHHERFSH